MLRSTSSPEARIEVALEPLRLAGNIKSGDIERVNLCDTTSRVRIQKVEGNDSPLSFITYLKLRI
jgi:hypothetical protein